MHRKRPRNFMGLECFCKNEWEKYYTVKKCHADRLFSRKVGVMQPGYWEFFPFCLKKLLFDCCFFFFLFHFICLLCNCIKCRKPSDTTYRGFICFFILFFFPSQKSIQCNTCPDLGSRSLRSAPNT